MLQVKKLKIHGYIAELPRTQSKINAKREGAKNHLIDFINANPTISIRQAAQAVGMSFGSTQRFLKEDLHKLQEFHQLLPPDYHKRVEFAEWVLSLSIEALLQFSCSDEAYFYLTIPVYGVTKSHLKSLKSHCKTKKF